MVKKAFFFLLIFLNQIGIAQTDLSYYLPKSITYDQKIPKPSDIIGHEVGEWHITHDRLVNYMYALADASDRVSIEQTGKTYEGRPQLLLTITSSDNHKNLQEIKKEHLKLVEPNTSGSVNTDEQPVVVWQGYSIHGNESSGSNASMVVAYHYAAAQGEEIQDVLENCVILLDPAYNPDGLTRFSTWANSNRSKNLVADPNSRELNEDWPYGRTNHYLFDLNRDWLPLQHPESRSRIAKFHEWKPNILTDHHEMGTNSTFFFQPGIPSRNNPLTPENTYVLTEQIASFHAAALDNIGSLYYTKESFDDFYYGKGSTYPDINGSVGILFEQASSRGHLQESVHGELSFPFTIRNQFVTSLSTTKAAVALRPSLLEHQKEFYKKAIEMAKEDTRKAVIYSARDDHSKLTAFNKMLDQHQITVNRINRDASFNGKRFDKDYTFVVRLDQPQYRLIRAIFETGTSFNDSLFYDVSSWTMPLAFDLEYAFLDSRSYSGLEVASRHKPEQHTLTDFEKSNYAFVFNWKDYLAPKALYQIMKAGIRTKVSSEEFTTTDRTFERGSIIIPVYNQEKSTEEINDFFESLQAKYPFKFYAINSGNADGIKLGSPSIQALEKPEIALLVEDGVRSYDAGEIWHLLDYRFDMTVTLLPLRILNKTDISRYNTIVMPDGNYSGITDKGTEQLNEWVKAGGTLIAIKRANNWLIKNDFIDIKVKTAPKDTSFRKPYADLNKYRGAQVTGGAIFQTNIDTTHPLGYGVTGSQLPVFYNGNTMFNKPKNVYSYPLVFTSDPLMSGYISEENLERLKSSPGIVISRNGQGQVISFSFNPNFRAFWYGTNRVFLNAIFYDNVISSRAMD
jgi:hypothetical protein